MTSLFIRGNGPDGVDLEGELPTRRKDIVPLPEGEERYTLLKKLVKERKHRALAYDNKDGCLLMDMQTANMLTMVCEALGPANREKFLAMDLGKMVDTGWKLVK